MAVNLLKEFDTVFGAADIYRRLVENLHDGIYVADAKGNLVYINQAFVSILGYASKDELVGLNLADRLYVHAEDHQEFLKRIKKLSFVRDYEVKNKRKDGSVVVLSVTSNIIYGEGNEIIGVEGVIHDVTGHKKLEKDLMVLKSAVAQAADHVMITDKEGIIQYVNSAFEETTGYNRQEAIGKTPRILQSGKQGREYYRDLWEKILAGKTFHSHVINKKKNGELYVADQTISPITGESGEITHFVSIWKDITEKVRLEERLNAEKHKLEEIVGFDEKVSSIRKFDRLFDFVVDKTIEILNAKKCSIMLVDHQQGDLCIKSARGFEDDIFARKVKIGEGVAGLVAQEGKPVLVKDVRQEAGFQQAARFSYLGHSFMSVPITVDKQIVGVINVAEKGKNEDECFDEIDLRILCSISREVAVAIENLKMHKELHFLAIIDPTTNLHNFRYSSRTLDYEIKRTKRFLRPLSLMMIDVDHFKYYNDSFGHSKGDELLRSIGEILQQNVREIDVVCRYGSDEFIIILPETEKEAALGIAERMRKSVEGAQFPGRVTISIGIGVYDQNMNRHELTLRATLALEEAKKQGRNRAAIFG